ncbi:MAG: DUF3563 domain-containing protein [Proteobacteria bacterium]|jgi:hypothetical protein|uniref:DUF3563 domain-containing protein n=1 Tax=Roseateles sp. TaxID=1971397 RepID=UPI000FBA4636|nr:DUF3563 family protein [Burkholderiaceae bacterium]MCH8855767.1 DUF3563 domain-containing protein [Pseudomonadota bacterium]RTL23567.1 MAG: DUF3563 domain-containing protein [Burkholderiales bacterium]
MEFIQSLISSLRSALSVPTQADADERYLADAVDHVDLERRIASQARAYQALAPLNIGR